MKTNSAIQKPSVYVVKEELRNEQNIKTVFGSTSFILPGSKNVTYRSFKSDVLKDTSTQTSKTVVQLDLNEDSPRMSPDSLSPKTDYQDDPDQEMCFTLDRPSIVSKGLKFSRKDYVLRYLHKPATQKEATKQNAAPENSLTKVFLEKARIKSVETSSSVISRSNFLQQTSPLRNIIPIVQEQNFKSHSYAAIVEQFPQPTDFPNTRFKVKSIREKSPTLDITKPVKYFCTKELHLNLNNTKLSPKNLRNHSFMSPTFSSEQKNQMREINNVTKLISPTRRGRSASPKTNAEQSQSLGKKIPYIDKSSSSIFHGKGDFKLNLISPRLFDDPQFRVYPLPNMASHATNKLLEASINFPLDRRVEGGSSWHPQRVPSSSELTLINDNAASSNTYEQKVELNYELEQIRTSSLQNSQQVLKNRFIKNTYTFLSTLRKVRYFSEITDSSYDYDLGCVITMSETQDDIVNHGTVGAATTNMAGGDSTFAKSEM